MRKVSGEAVRELPAGRNIIGTPTRSRPESFLKSAALSRPGDYDKAAELTRKNFNGLVAYDSSEEKEFRFGSYTTAGELKIWTGIDSASVTDYHRVLLLEDAVARVTLTAEG